MNKITINNYEAFVLDYVEGNLDEATIHELKAFVINHPELDIDLEDLDLPTMNEEKIEFGFKTELKKLQPPVSDEMLFDYLEQNLSEEENKLIESNLLENKFLSLNFGLLKKTVLSVDFDDVLVNKSGLYKSEEDFVLRDRVFLYFEGQLSLDEKADFEAELQTNSLLQKELVLYSKTKLFAEKQVVFPDKEELKMWTLAYFEGLLADREKLAFETALKESKLLQAELALYTKTKLSADRSVVYPDRAALKKGARVISLFAYRSVMAAAAAVLLIVGFFVVFNYYNSDPVVAKPGLSLVVKPTQYPVIKKMPMQKGGNMAANDKAVSPTQKQPAIEVPKTLPPAKEVLPEPSLANQVKQTPASGGELKIEQRQVPSVENVKAEELIAREQKSVNQENNVPGDAATSLTEASEKYTVLLASADADDENGAPSETGFWSRAIKLAKRANKMGVKSIDVNETSRKKFSLSFNSFSVEKH